MHLNSRPCKLGPSLNCRTEKHGDDDVPACDIPIEGFLLQREEANQIVGDLFWESLFDNRSAGQAPAILHPHINPRVLADKYEGEVRIVLGPNQKDLDLDGIQLSRLKLTPVEGGLIELQFKIQCSQDIEKFVHKLVARQATEIALSVTFGDKVERAKSKQAELPMDHTDGDDKPEGDDFERNTAAHVDAFKRGRKGKNGAAAH